MGGKINSPVGLPAAPAQQTQQEQDFVHSNQQTITEHYFPTFIIVLRSDAEEPGIPKNVLDNTLKSELTEQVEIKKGNCG